MLLKVNPHKIEIVKSPVNEREINISKCQFEFADEITNDYVKEAYFTFGGTTYKQIIVNDECDFPSEVLTKKGTVEIGVVAYLVENETEIKRYNPSPAYFDTWVGSLKDNAENSEPITPSEMEQYEQALNDGLNEVNDKLDEIDQAIDDVNEAIIETNNLDLDVDKQGKVATVTLTKKDASTKTVTLSDGTSLQFKWDGTKLGIKTDNEQSYTYVDLEGPQGKQGIPGPQGEEGKTGPQGETGATGNGILSIQKTATVGLVDTYTITFTDGTTTTFDVTNGEDGEVTQKQLDETNNNVSWLQTLTEQMPHVSGQGIDLSLESVLNYRLMKFLPQGVSSQESTTGSNIIGLDNEQYHVNLRAGDKIVVTNETDSTVTIDLFTNYGDTTRNNYWTITTAQSPRVITIANDSLAIKWHSVPNGKAWVNLGETVLPYEPYTGGIPAPNPDYPQNVKSVTGENGVVIGNENLFNINNISKTTINISGTQSEFSISQLNNNVNTEIPIVFKENTPYNISGYYSSTRANGSLRVTYTDNTTENIYGVFDNSTINKTAFTYTSNNNKTISLLEFRLFTNGNFTIYDFQIKEGSTAPTTYVEHEEQNYQLSLGNIELNSSPDGTIRDQIIGKPNDWYKREYIGKVVLDGSENWGYYGSTNAPYRVTLPRAGKLSKDNNTIPYMMSNNFKSVSFNDTWPNYDSLITASTNSPTLYVRYTDITSLDAFKVWLSSHNTTVYYPLVQYTDIPITDTILINQLNDIYNNAHSYNGTTNITTTYEDGNEQMYLDIEALKNVWDTSL